MKVSGFFSQKVLCLHCAQFGERWVFLVFYKYLKPKDEIVWIIWVTNIKTSRNFILGRIPLKTFSVSLNQETRKWDFPITQLRDKKSHLPVFVLLRCQILFTSILRINANFYPLIATWKSSICGFWHNNLSNFSKCFVLEKNSF